MKVILKSLIILLSLFSIESLNAQPEKFGEPIIPLQPNSSPLFGKDIVIHDEPDRDQRNVAICSAFNGWLFTEYTYTNAYYDFAASTILKSTDNGITWTVLIDMYHPLVHSEFKSIDITVTGDSISNLKLFLAYIVSDKSSTTGIGDAHVLRFNGITGDYEDEILFDNFSYCIALACDFIYPASNSNPHSIGVLHSKYSYTGNDSLIFNSSSNGGMSLDSRQVVAVSGSRFHKVALTYGRSPSWNSGRYFAAWEEQDDFGSMRGRIYTSHTNPNYNSLFTTPVNLDGLDTTDFNMCRNPSIACQYNNVDNDSSNLTEIILFDRYNKSNQRHDIRGYYNLQATTTSHFTKLNLSDSLHNNLQPSINFNPFDSSFMVTYYDSTSQKLPFLLNNCSLATPNAWQIVSSGYSDDTNLADPYPKVALNIGKQQGANNWAGEGTGGNGVAMFDSPYSTWTGISGNNTTDNNELFWVYPNPCNYLLTVAFKVKRTEAVTITLYNLIGTPMGIVADQLYPNGLYLINYDVSNFSDGSYLLTYRKGNIAQTCKVLIIR